MQMDELPPMYPLACVLKDGTIVRPDQRMRTWDAEHLSGYLADLLCIVTHPLHPCESRQPWYEKIGVVLCEYKRRYMDVYRAHRYYEELQAKSQQRRRHL